MRLLNNRGQTPASPDGDAGVCPQNLNLIKEFTFAEFKLYYKDSVLGYLWSFLNPLLLFGTLYLIFTFFVRFEVPHYQLYLLLGIVVWNFLANATTTSMESLLMKEPLIKKVSFPHAVIIISTCLSSLITFGFNLLVFFVFLICSGVVPEVKFLLFFVYLVPLFCGVLGLSFFLSALYVNFRDLSHIWQVLLQIGFWLTPIVYPVALIPARFRFFFGLNPMYGIIQSLRQIMIYNRWPSLKLTAAVFFISVAVLVLGYYLFKRRSPYFAEEI